jgi:hypothetical protein
VLNLTAYETFFNERRPFFVEGKGLFTFTVNCVVVVDCSTGEGLFYSRRIGRAPQLADIYPDASAPQATRIIGAAKMTGRMPGGFSIGALEAVTDHVEGPDGTSLEPTTNYAVVRGNQDSRSGNTSLCNLKSGNHPSAEAREPHCSLGRPNTKEIPASRHRAYASVATRVSSPRLRKSGAVMVSTDTMAST